jgi:hypothetical protein
VTSIAGYSNVPSLSHRRGTRAQINASAAANGLRTGEVYLITDEGRLTVGTAVNAHQAAAKQGEAGGIDPWTWIKLAADVANSTVTLASVTGLTFTALANTTYVVELVGTFQSAATTTGIALALKIPSGSISGFAEHAISTTGSNINEQIADTTTPGATTGVRAAATNVPILGKYIVAVGATGGTVQLQFRSEVAASAVTMKAAVTAMGFRAI